MAVDTKATAPAIHVRVNGSQTGNKTAETAKKAQEAYQQMKEQQIKPVEKKPE